MSNYNECIKRKYKKPIFIKCKDLGLDVNKSMTMEELCKIYHDYFEKNKESLSKQSPKKIQIFPKIIIDTDYHKYKTKDLILICRKRGISLRSLTRSYVIQRLEKDDKEKSSSSKEISIPKEKSSSSKENKIYSNYSVKELKSLCRERRIPLNSYLKSYLIEKLEKYDQSKEKSPLKEKSIPKEKSPLKEKSILKEKSMTENLFEERKFNELAEYIKQCYL